MVITLYFLSKINVGREKQKEMGDVGEVLEKQQDVQVFTKIETFWKLPTYKIILI